MQQAIVAQTIQAMKEHLDALTLGTIEEVEKGQQTYFQLLKALRDIPVPLAPLDMAEAAVGDIHAEVSPQSLTEEPPVVAVETQELLPEGKAYRFERKLKGGFLSGINAFVPETVVRDLSLEHGDMVSATLIPGTEDKPKYVYRLAEATGKHLKDRVFFQFCLVEWDASLNSLVVNRTADGRSIRLDEVPQTVLLPKYDVDALRVEEGDVIDVAYMQSAPSHKKIVWKYETSELEELVKTGNTKVKLEKRNKKQYEQVFAGKTVLMLGLEPEQAGFAKEVKNRGGSFLCLNGREAKETLTSTFSKADVAIFMLGHVSHGATIWASQFCKDHDIPFTGLHTFGKSLFVRTAQELLEENVAAVLSMM